MPLTSVDNDRTLNDCTFKNSQPLFEVAHSHYKALQIHFKASEIEDSFLHSSRSRSMLHVYYDALATLSSCIIDIQDKVFQI